MSGVLARAASLVVEPGAEAEPRVGAVSGAARALVLGAPADAVPLAAALAGSLRARERAPAALLCVWAPSARGPSPSAWTSVGARRLAARLAARELEVRAAGRLAWLALPPEPGQTLGRLLGWLDAPVVTVQAGPRTDEHDELVAAHDIVIAVRPAAGGALSASGAEALTALALDGLGAATVACDPVAAGLARWRARAGLARLPAGHAALDALGPAGRTAA